MADFTGLECDVDRSREDGVRRLPIGDGQVVDLCPSCWAKHNLDALFEVARPAPQQQKAPRATRGEGHRVVPEETRRIKKWCELNDVSLKGGPVPNDVREAWKQNSPAAVYWKYVGDGEPAQVGVMPPDARPEGWSEAVGQG